MEILSFHSKKEASSASWFRTQTSPQAICHRAREIFFGVLDFGLGFAFVKAACGMPNYGLFRVSKSQGQALLQTLADKIQLPVLHKVETLNDPVKACSRTRETMQGQNPEHSAITANLPNALPKP